MEILPEVVEKLDGEFMKEWEQIKNDLIIFDIEDFHKSLAEFGNEHDCPVINQYCQELSMSLLSFDVEEIRLRINEFPIMVGKLKK